MAHFACINWNMPFQRRFVQGSYDHGDLPLNQASWSVFFDKAHPNTGEQENQKKTKVVFFHRFRTRFFGLQIKTDIVDGRNPANQLMLVVYPIIYQVLYIPGG